MPGHGTLIKRDDIIPYRDMILAVQQKVQQMIAQGKTVQEVLAAKLTAPYDAKVAGGTESSADRFITRGVSGAERAGEVSPAEPDDRHVRAAISLLATRAWPC